MPSKSRKADHESVGAWTKRCYLAGRIAMDAALRPYDLGATQWYVLYHLAEEGSLMQRDVLRILAVERATLSGVVSTLVQKGLVEQVPDRVDQRQKRLLLTKAGKKLWQKLPDLSVIHRGAFDGIEDADIAVTINVLRTATERLEQLWEKESDR